MGLTPARPYIRVLHTRRLGRVAVLLLVAWELLAWAAARALVTRSELPQSAALVVLSGSTSYVERTRWAAQLFMEGRAPRVLLTNDDTRGGWSSEQQRNPLFVEQATAELRRAGVPAERIEVLPQAVTNTHDEAALLREYAASHDLRSLLVVTSAYHSRRALWTLRRVFQRSGIDVGLSAAPITGQTPAPATWWLSATGWRMVAGEYLKFIYYRLHYS